MNRWSIKPGSLVILLGVLLFILAVQVLPQVDLPDTAFHEDTAPIVTKSRAISAPALQALILPTAFSLLSRVTHPMPVVEVTEVSPSSTKAVAILLCCLLR